MKKFFENRERLKANLKKLGWIGFLFFLAKGIIWLLVGKYIISGIF